MGDKTDSGQGSEKPRLMAAALRLLISREDQTATDPEGLAAEARRGTAASNRLSAVIHHLV